VTTLDHAGQDRQSPDKWRKEIDLHHLLKELDVANEHGYWSIDSCDVGQEVNAALVGLQLAQELCVGRGIRQITNHRSQSALSIAPRYFARNLIDIDSENPGAAMDKIERQLSTDTRGRPRDDGDLIGEVIQRLGLRPGHGSPPSSDVDSLVEPTMSVNKMVTI
jgi:hypothetical protein